MKNEKIEIESVENVENIEKEVELFREYVSDEEARKLSDLQREMMESYTKTYREEHGQVNTRAWLEEELKKQLPDYANQEIQEMSSEIVETLALTETKKGELRAAVAAGRSKESWLAASLKQSTSHLSAQESARYLQGLDDAVKEANAQWQDTLTTKAGAINQNRNLDGFIAEQKHVNSYNMKAKALGGDLHAEVLKPKPGETYAKNSVDIVIKDSSGKIVSRYQAKYGATAEETIKLIEKGDYRGQQLLVPPEQVEEVQRAFPNRKVSSTIGEGNIQSDSFSKEEAKRMQEEAQSGNWLETDWNEYATKDIALGIGKQVGTSCLQGAAIGAGSYAIGKMINGEPIDGEEVVEAAITTGADFGVKTATAGALKVAAEKEIIKVIPKGTPASTLTNIAFVAVEDVKILGKVAEGELTVKEGLDEMEQTTVATVAGIAASKTGGAAGAAIGSVLGPVGTMVGGFVGNAVGYMAGSSVGKAITKAGQKVRDTARKVVSKVADTVREGAARLFSGVCGLFGF